MFFVSVAMHHLPNVKKEPLYWLKDETGKDKFIYAKDLLELRQEEKRIRIKQDKNIKISKAINHLQTGQQYG